MKLSDLDFSALLPRFMRAQTDDVAMGDALSWMLKARQAGVESLNVLEWLRTTTNVEQMDDLAKALGLVWWKPDWNLETKREMLLKSELIRQNPGTKWALEFVLRKWFADDTLQVQEWFDYGGAPYTFRILTSSPDVQRQLQFSRIMDSIKRTSQSMDGIFLGFSMRGSARIGAKGSESRTDHGQAIRWPYLPKGTRYTHPEALEELLWESGGTGTDAARAAVADATGTGGVLTKDFPLIYAGDDTSTALPVKSTTRAAYQQAMASQWQAVGADIAEPATSWVWPREAPPEPSPLLDGILAYFPFSLDEMTGQPSLKSVCSAHELSAHAPVSSATGVAGAGLEQVGARNSLSSGISIQQNASWAISLWLWRNPDATDFTCIGKGSSAVTPEDNASIYIDSPGVVVASYISGSRREFGRVSVQPGVWTHLVFSCDASAEVLTCYIDGVLAGDVEFSGRDQHFVLAWLFGRDDSDTHGLNGAADEVGVWSRALSAEEVSQLYQAGLDGKSYPFEGV